MDELLTLPAVAKILGLKERTVYVWSKEGKIPAFKIGKAWRYRSTEIDDWLELHRPVNSEVSDSAVEQLGSPLLEQLKLLPSLKIEIPKRKAPIVLNDTKNQIERELSQWDPIMREDRLLVTDQYPNPFTNNEIATLQLLDQGYTTKDISDLLGLPEQTIGDYLVKIFEKIKFHLGIEAYLEAYEKHLPQLTERQVRRSRSAEIDPEHKKDRFAQEIQPDQLVKTSQESVSEVGQIPSFADLKQSTEMSDNDNELRIVYNIERGTDSLVQRSLEYLRDSQQRGQGLANVEELDLEGWDLFRAAREDRVDIARALIDSGADIEAKNDWEATPLDYAAVNNSLDVARLLIESGADIEAKKNPTISPWYKSLTAAGTGITFRNARPNFPISKPYAPYRNRFEGFRSDRSRILEVLSDGYGRGLFEIANAIWELDSESDIGYGLIRKSLASTLSREVKRKNLFRWARGRFSTRRYEKRAWPFKQAIKYGLIDLSRVPEALMEGHGKPFYNFEAAVRNFEPFAMQRFANVDQVDPFNFKVQGTLDSLERSTACDYFNNLIDVDLLAVPVLGIESQLIRRRENELIFHEEDIVTVSEEFIGKSPKVELKSNVEIVPQENKSQRWYFEKTRNGTYVSLLGSEDDLDVVVSALVDFEITVLRSARAYRPASNGVSYDWYIAIQDASEQNVKQAIENIQVTSPTERPFHKNLAPKSLSVSFSGFGGPPGTSRGVGRFRFLYSPDSAVVEFLNSHERIRKEITAVIAFRALFYEFIDEGEG